MLQLKRRKEHPEISQNQVSTEYTSTHINSSMKLTERTRGLVQLSTHISAKDKLDVIHLEVSGMLLLVSPKCIAIAQCMAVPTLLLCDLPSSNVTKQ